MGAETTAAGGQTAGKDRPGYRQVVAADGWGWWATTTFCARVPDAMAALSLVLLGHFATGSFAIGGLASGAHALAEAAAAPLLGAHVERWPRHLHVRLALVARALLYAALAGTATVAPASALVLVAGLAGAVAAGVPGGLRSMIQHIVPGDALHPAMSLDTTLLELAWTIAPALAAGLTAVADPRLSLAAMALLVGVAALLARRLPQPAARVRREDAGVAPGGRGAWRLLLPAASSLAFGVVGGFAGGVLDTATPPALGAAGVAASLAGVLFTGYSVTSVIGGLLFGLRHWPGSPRRQAALMLSCLCLTLLPAALFPSLATLAGCVVGAGLFAAPQLTARSLALQSDLPRSLWSAGFSTLYAANGLGYGAAGFAVGLLLRFGVVTAFAGPLVVCLVAALGPLVTATTSRRRAPRQVDEARP